MLRHLLPALAALAVCAPALASAQQTVSPTKKVVELTEQGNAAYNAGKYQEAVAAFEQAAIMQPLNITHLNHGRALHRVGRCHEAEDAYTKAQTVIYQIAKPSPQEVSAAAKRYIDDLDRDCDGELTVACDPAAMTISIDGKPKQACDGKPVAVTRGYHVVKGFHGDKVVEQGVEVSFKRPGNVSLNLQVVKEVVEKEVVKEVIKEVPVEKEVIKEVIVEKEVDKLPTPENSGDGKGKDGNAQIVVNVGNQDKDTSNPTAAWINIGIGLGLVGTGVLLDNVFASSANDKQAQGEDIGAGDYLLYATPVLMYVVGSILTINGLTKF